MIRTIILAAALAFAGAANAMPIVQPDAGDTIIKVADGCGPNRYRGPGGACHLFGRGPYPDGYYEFQPAQANWGNGCPPGYWRGPWGHCRNTPYHGRLPGGGWK